jgi:hypothetical protein
MTLIGPPWELSQISEPARAKRERRRTRQLLTRGRLIEYLDTPCRYCSVLITDWNGREDWKSAEPRSSDCAIAWQLQKLRQRREHLPALKFGEGQHDAGGIHAATSAHSSSSSSMAFLAV